MMTPEQDPARRVMAVLARALVITLVATVIAMLVAFSLPGVLEPLQFLSAPVSITVTSVTFWWVRKTLNIDGDEPPVIDEPPSPPDDRARNREVMERRLSRAGPPRPGSHTA